MYTRGIEWKTYVVDTFSSSNVRKIKTRIRNKKQKLKFCLNLIDLPDIFGLFMRSVAESSPSAYRLASRGRCRWCPMLVGLHIILPYIERWWRRNFYFYDSVGHHLLRLMYWKEPREDKKSKRPRSVLLYKRPSRLIHHSVFCLASLGFFRPGFFSVGAKLE